MIIFALEIMKKCVFLDRDGVINKDYVDYVYTLEKFEFIPGAVEAIKSFKKAGYLLVVITNQSGIVKGLFDHKDVLMIHDHINKACGGVFDDIYYSPYNDNWTNSLSRKPRTLMWERAIAKFDIDIEQSWMVGDKETDLIPAKKLGIKTIHICDEYPSPQADYIVKNLLEASKKIL